MLMFHLIHVLLLAQQALGIAETDRLWPSWRPWRPAAPQVTDSRDVTYVGIYQSGVEAFLGIKYGQDTSGQNRYKPPQPHVYHPGSTVEVQNIGPPCPQPLGTSSFYPLVQQNITDISEDCLLLNIQRPNGTHAHSKLPVMIFIHGGSFFLSSKDEPILQPPGLILESIENGYPVMYVAMDYRLGSFGFAQNAALIAEGSLNAGLLDQRLALDWVHDNIEAFGGDPNRVTIFGQSSGGLAVGLQTMAYGASKPVPFQQVIAESQMLENGITGNFTREAMSRFVAATTCNETALDSAETIACLRALPLDQLNAAQTNTYSTGPAANLGDEWLPIVDGPGGFLPEAPSALIRQGRFANITLIAGWVDGDANIFPPMNISTAADTAEYLHEYLPGFNKTSLNRLESLYPISEFSADPAANLSAEYFRASRITRDVLFVCQAIHYGTALHKANNRVYYYHQNQTFLTPILSSPQIGLPGIGKIHTSELAYVFGNLSHYDVPGFPFLPNATDYSLLKRQSRSWSSFGAKGRPSLPGRWRHTLRGWDDAYSFQPHSHLSLDLNSNSNVNYRISTRFDTNSPQQIFINSKLEGKLAGRDDDKRETEDKYGRGYGQDNDLLSTSSSPISSKYIHYTHHRHDHHHPSKDDGQEDIQIYVIGGPHEGLSVWRKPDGHHDCERDHFPENQREQDSHEQDEHKHRRHCDHRRRYNAALVAQRLSERCGFLNQPDIILQQRY